MPANTDSSPSRSTPPATPEEQEPAEPVIDLHELAERVWALLKEELRLERERNGAR